MKRLFSYFTYNFILLPIPFALMLYGLYPFKDSWGLALFILFVGLIGFYFPLKKYKRVYVKNSSLIIYELFSEQYKEVHKDQIVSIGRFILFDKLNYQVKFIDANDKKQSIYFFKNFFILDMKEAIKSLISES